MVVDEFGPVLDAAPSGPHLGEALRSTLGLYHVTRRLLLVGIERWAAQTVQTHQVVKALGSGLEDIKYRDYKA